MARTAEKYQNTLAIFGRGFLWEENKKREVVAKYGGIFGGTRNTIKFKTDYIQ